MAESIYVVQYVEINGFRYPQPIRKVPTSLRRKQSDSSLTSSDDPKKRESKSAPYRNTRYAILLATKESYMEKSVSGITDTSRTWCKTLLNSEEVIPIESLFRDDVFEKTCLKVQDRIEAQVIKDTSPLIVPSAETLATYGATNLNHLIEASTKAGQPAYQWRVQDHSQTVLSGLGNLHLQLSSSKKSSPFIGSLWDT